jgi:hypothetical protein
MPAVGTLRRQLLDWLRLQPDGATDEEMQTGVPMKPSTQRPRRVELLEGGLILDSGAKRKCESGREAVVWKAKT